MSNYPKKVADSLLPLSLAGTLPKAFEEWYFTENIEDHYEPVETCELCGQEDLRYHFEIANQHTKKTLWVGSHCILQFQVAVYERGRKLTEKEAKTKLEKLTQKMRLESCIRSLERFAEKDDNPILKSALEYYRRHKKLTPKLAFVVFWRLSKNKIDHQPSFFKIELKSSRYIQDLREMPTKRVHFFWFALSAHQRARAIEMGHKPPPGN